MIWCSLSQDTTDTNVLSGTTIDGNTENNSNGWQIFDAGRLSGESQNITWSWQPHSAPTLAQGESISHYTYTVNLHNGLSGTNVNFLLKSYSLALGDPPHNSDNFTTITDYQSFSNTQEAQDHDHTMSIDVNGLITTTKANLYDYSGYTQVFDPLVFQIKYVWCFMTQ